LQNLSAQKALAPFAVFLGRIIFCSENIILNILNKKVQMIFYQFFSIIETFCATGKKAIFCVYTKHHSFPVSVSGNETGKLYFLLPNFETEIFFSEKPETIFGKPGNPGKHISLSQVK
jgi:hypothetical protein